jgi:hypothetical protein
VRHGRGTQLYTVDGSIYSGQFVMGLRHGPGAVMHLNGNRFEGTFANDHARGIGRFLLHVGRAHGADDGGAGEVVRLRVYGY